jgi:hypothetical protein
MTTTPPRLGLRANLPQFVLLVAVNALVGAMVGQERTVVPLLAEQVFAVGAFTAALTPTWPPAACPIGTAANPS